MTQWEYKIEPYDGMGDYQNLKAKSDPTNYYQKIINVEEGLNLMGERHWELVHVDKEASVLLFKRPRMNYTYGDEYD